MLRRFIFVSVLIGCTALGVLAARPATFVLTDGQRVSGELTYKGGSAFTLSGRDYPSTQVAIIAFEPGDPPVSELNQLPSTDNPSDEHERHMFVLRDGQVIHGKLYHITPDGETIWFDPVGATSAASRRQLPASQISRIYITPSGARSVYASLLNASTSTSRPVAVAPAGGGGITVNGNQRWTDTGMTVNKGDRVSFHASGQIRVAAGNAPETLASPDGSATYQGSRANYPVPTMAAGALIGSVGGGAPFPIGSNTQPITMPAAGRLYLGINDDGLGDNSGSFTVTITR